MLLTPTIPSLGAFVMSGVYDIPAVQTDIVGVFTNKFADGRDPRRGPARGHAHDRGDASTSSRPSWAWTALELRRKNFIAADDVPARGRDRRRL